jgi:UDP-N-acetylmuramoyl-tripeptide--D-alanyl-D-alanine ligase
MDTHQIASALSAAEPLSPARLQIIPAGHGVTIINDAFNANPESTAAALRRIGHNLYVSGHMVQLRLM